MGGVSQEMYVIALFSDIFHFPGGTLVYVVLVTFSDHAVPTSHQLKFFFLKG